MATIENLPFSYGELIDAVWEGLVSERPHDDGSMFIYNYTPMVQYSRHWTPVTKACRGLILDRDQNIIARPFEKIFNYTEIVPDPVIFDRRPQVSDKADGSLGIIYKNSSHRWAVATRGSFHSAQASWATDWLYWEMPDFEQPTNVTTLVEIIYPENRICVDYKDRAELVLIAAIDNETGGDIPLELVDWWDGARIDEHFGIKDIDDAYRFATSDEYDGKEGVVCTWFKYGKPSFRLKVKHPEYVRLHGIIHNFSKKKVWESLSAGEDFMAMLQDVPDEFYSEVKQIVKDFVERYNTIETEALEEYDKIKQIRPRKNFAEQAKNKKYPAIMFAMFDGKDYSKSIWNMIKPTGEEDG